MQVSKVVDLKPIKMMTIAVQLLCVSEQLLCVSDNEDNDDDDGSGPSVLCDIYYLKKIAKVSPISVQRRGHIL